MAIYEIINPSDYCTIDADFASASAACLLVGNGSYGLKAESDGETSMPIFVFGGALEWFQERFGEHLETYIPANKTDIADALDSLVTGERDEVELGLKNATDKAAYRIEWEDKHRSSMNAIQQRARQIAANLRKQ